MVELPKEFIDYTRKLMGEERFARFLAAFDEEVKIDFGLPTEESDRAAKLAVARAKEDMQKHLYDVLVLGPVVPNPNPSREDKALTVMISSSVRIGLLTNHLPIKEVAKNISKESITDKTAIFHTSLKRDFRINNPRIAVLALNPQPGAEEQEIIKPAIEELEKKGIQAYGPYTANEFFGQKLQYDFDGILAMYDDQGNVPFKTIATEYGVKMKAGFPFVITTPDHGPAFDIAGKGQADPASLRHAIYAAIDFCRNRRNYDEPLGNPLPKLYHEKREDGDKARFAQKKPIPPKKGTEAAAAVPPPITNDEE